MLKELEEALKEVRKLNERLFARTVALFAARQETKQLKSENNRLQHTVDLLLKGAKLSRSQRFGQKSEKTAYLIGEQLSLLPSTDIAAAAKPLKKPRVKPRRKLGAKEWQNRISAELETREILHRLTDETLICEVCGNGLAVIGRKLVRTEYDLGLPYSRRVEHYAEKCMCRLCEPMEYGEGRQVIEANVPKPLMPGTSLSNYSYAFLCFSKYYLSLPLYRQSDAFRLMGVPITRQTLTNNVLRAAEYFKPVYDELHRLILTLRVLHADETVFQVLRESGRKATQKSSMWVYCTAECEEQQIILYDYRLSRASEYPLEYLDGFEGYLHCDGWGAYHRLSDINTLIISVGCWVHARRNFTDALKIEAGEVRGDVAAMPYCEIFAQIFELEREFADLPRDDSYKARYEARLKHIKPLADRLYELVYGHSGLDKDALGKAVNYMRNQRKYLLRVLDDGRLEFSNNHAENVIRPFVVGRKNWLFAESVGGANANAIFYSIIQTAIINKLNPFDYIRRVLDLSADDTSVQNLLPWNVAM